VPVLNKDCPVGLEEEGRNLRLTHLIHWGRSLRVLLFGRSNATTDARQVYRHGRIYMDAGGSSQSDLAGLKRVPSNICRPPRVASPLVA
jgi:hypothetical protein